MFTAFLIAVLAFTNIPVFPKAAVEMLNSQGIEAKLGSDGGFVFFAPGLLFESGSSNVSTDNVEKIKVIVQVLNLNGIDDDLVYFEGHTDSDGDIDYNLKLGYDRALSVAQLYFKQGLTQDRAIIKSYGEFIPRSDNPAENRRVELVVIDTEN